MTDLPLLFSDEMMRANLARTKCQTRRAQGLGDINKSPGAWHLDRHEDGIYKFVSDHGNKVIVCPYGIVTEGRKMWAREAWRPVRKEGDVIEIEYRADGAVLQFPCPSYLPMQSRTQWRSPIHMHRAFCRFERPLVSITLERLSDMSHEEALAEGVQSIAEYRTLWDKLNPTTGAESNPWVWCIQYQNDI